MEEMKNVVLESSFNKLSLNIGGSGHAYCDNSWFQDNIQIPFSRIYYLLDGEGILSYNDKTIIMKPGFLYFVPFDFPFLGTCESHMEKIYFHLNLSFFGKIDLFDSCFDIITLPCDYAQEVANLYDSNKTSDILKLKNILYSDIINLINFIGIDTELSVYSDIVKKTINYIDQNVSSQLKISDISSALFVSESMLSKQFRAELGIPIGKYISNKLVAEIKLALLNKHSSISETCETFGFCDRSYFARFFKNKTGKTPTQFKRNYEKSPL